MKIEKIEVFVVGPEEKHYTWSEDIPEIYQSNTILRMHTDKGIIGESAVWNATYFEYDKYTAESLKHFLPILIGRDPLDKDSILYDIRPRVFPMPPGAQAAIDNCLWDIIGKQANVPIYKLLGGRRDKIKSYASTVMYESIDEYLRVIEDMKNQGFQAVKIKVGQLEIKEDLKRVKLARKILGDKIELRLDANRSWNWDQALNFLSSIKEDKIHYCEEPLRDITKIEKLYDETKIPLALDETIWEKSNPKNLPKEGIKAYILKPCLLGGWYNTKLWIDFAEIEDIQVILSSSFETGLGLNWNAYLSANLIKKQLPSGLDTVKWFKHDIIDPPFEIKNGFYVFPDSWPEAKNNYLKFLDKGTFLTSF